MQSVNLDDQSRLKLIQILSGCKKIVCTLAMGGGINFNKFDMMAFSDELLMAIYTLEHPITTKELKEN